MYKQYLLSQFCPVESVSNVNQTGEGMTTVIVDTVLRKAYADTRVTRTYKVGLLFKRKEEEYSDTLMKFWRVQGCLIVAAGNIKDIHKQVKRILDGKDPRPQTSAMLSLHVNGNVIESNPSKEGYGHIIRTPCMRYLLMGSGKGHALSRLCIGYTPEDAIKDAANHDRYTGSEVLSQSY